VREVDAGRRTSDIARDLGISRARVHQLVTKTTGDSTYRQKIETQQVAERRRSEAKKKYRRVLRGKFSSRTGARALQHSDEELLQYLRDFADERPDLIPFGPTIWTQHAVYPDGTKVAKRATSMTYLKRWGKFSAALEAAGLPVYVEKSDYPRISDEQILSDLRSFLLDPAVLNGGAVAYQQWRLTQDPMPTSMSSIRLRAPWREWKAEALRSLGLDSQERVDVYIDSILDEVVKQHGVDPR
jgi:hypothetical protein